MIKKTCLSLCALLACGSLGLSASEEPCTPEVGTVVNFYPSIKPTPTAPQETPTLSYLTKNTISAKVHGTTMERLLKSEIYLLRLIEKLNRNPTVQIYITSGEHLEEPKFTTYYTLVLAGQERKNVLQTELELRENLKKYIERVNKPTTCCIVS